MEFLRVVLFILGGAVVFILITAIISAFYNHQRNKARKREKKPVREELTDFLLDNSYRKNVFSYLYYPVLAEGTLRVHHYQRIDEIVITNAGILILSVFDKVGRIDNSKDDIWIIINDDNRTEIESPLVTAEKCRQAVHALLKRSGYGKVPLYSTVVFTNDGSVPLSGDDDIIRMSELEKLLRDMSRKQVLSKIEQFYLSRILKGSGLTKEKIRKNKL
ncbi:MAG: NERD domain-containing protein [Clostridia bacterium]|nr:NERD domain-containing protein [Clostridia bacterium]